MQDRRHPYQSFDPRLIQDFLGHNRHLITLERFATGRSNTNYKLILSDDTICVLRLYAKGNPQQDAYILDLARTVVFVPEVLAQGPMWAIFTFIPGQMLSQMPEHLGKVAETIAQIASVQFDTPGQLNPDGSISTFSFGGLSGFITQQLDNSDVQQWLELGTLQKFQHILNHEAPRLAELDAESCLVHGDFNPSNILIDRGQVSGILDWEYSHAGTPYMDIGNLLRHTPIEHHHQIQWGLERGGMTLPPDWKRRAALVDLTSQLEFLTSRRSDSFKQQCVDRIHQFLQRSGGI